MIVFAMQLFAGAIEMYKWLNTKGIEALKYRRENMYLISNMKKSLKYHYNNISTYHPKIQYAIQELTSSEIKNVNKKLSDSHKGKNIQYSRPKEEIDDIKSAVHEMFGEIIKEFENYGEGKLFKVRNTFHPVGSMAEETSIKDPKEFDFIVVLDKLSTNSAFNIKLIDEIKKCATPFGLPRHLFRHAHIQVEEPIRNEYRNYILRDKYLDSTFISSNIKDILIKALKRHADAEIQKATGTLKLSSMEPGQRGPAGTFMMVWECRETNKKLPILIDTVLAIAVSNIQQSLRDEIVSDPALLIDGLPLDCFLIPAGPFKNKRCFKIAFTTAEVKLMQSLTDHHKACYRLLKEIMKTCDDEASVALSSYFFKTATLKHACHCDETVNFLSCLVDIITKLSKTCRHNNLVHVGEKSLFYPHNYVSEAPITVQQYNFRMFMIQHAFKDEFFPRTTLRMKIKAVALAIYILAKLKSCLLF